MSSPLSLSTITSELTPQHLFALPSTSCLRQRRAKIRAALAEGQHALICAGLPQARNFPANEYTDFRASSHFLYLVGQHLPEAILRLTRDSEVLYIPASTPSGALWHGEEKSNDQLSEEIGCEINSLSNLKSAITGATTLTLPPFQLNTQNHLMAWAGITPSSTGDEQLIDAMVKARLIHDEEGKKELRRAAKLTTLAHFAGLSATLKSRWAHELRAAMEAPLTSRGSRLAYAPIITPHGEVLHNHHYHAPLISGDLLLADVGAETPNGWAGDVTRTWPVNAQWSETQLSIYQVVLAALDASTRAAKAGVEYSELHEITRSVLTEGLREIGLLRGRFEDIKEANSISLFFPHGVGHLLGLDVHDMEDLGDHAGYARGRTRRQAFGWNYLRLDRPLCAGMAVTIEPGFYQVPALLNDPSWAGPHAGEFVNWEELKRFQDVRGIRIEDDLLITERAPEILSEMIPKDPSMIIEVINDR